MAFSGIIIPTKKIETTANYDDYRDYCNYHDYLDYRDQPHTSYTHVFLCSIIAVQQMAVCL